MTDELAQQTTESSGPAADGGATVTPEAVRARPSEPDLSDPSLYFNRELSWLDFNDRVLQLAEDPRVPLLERVNFCAIYEDNLDEFFMVRVAGLYEQVEQKIDARGADAMAPADVIGLIRQRTIELRQRLTRCFEDEIQPALAEHGIRIISLADANAKEREEVEHLFTSQVFPALTPLVIGRGRPFPYISNISLSIGVLLRNPEKGEEVAARVKVPKELLRRFLSIGDGRTFVPLEEVIAANLDDLFPGMEIVHHSLFRVTRDTDYDVSDEADDLLLAVEEEVRRRRFGEVVRLEISPDMEPRLLDQLVEAMNIEEEQVFETPGLIGLDDLTDVDSVQGFRELRYPPWQGVTPPQFQQGSRTHREVDVFAAMRQGDILVHHPYDSFTSSVERFVRKAVDDPNVLAIKQTVYRTSADSPLVPALIEASERGKQAVCLVELKARFDESANIRWARALEEAGVHVVYGIPGLKTHVKCVLVARREGDGVRELRPHRDRQLQPEDRPDLHRLRPLHRRSGDRRRHRRDVQLPDRLRPPEWLPQGAGSPPSTSRTASSARSSGRSRRTPPEHPARIRMKMNSLLDAPCIQALYRASQAGVEVDLNVRGICALRPGVPGVSENIRVVSIVGRFLEHSRIYSFERPDETPHLHRLRRPDAPQPLQPGRAAHAGRGRGHRAQLADVLDRAFADNTNSWELGSDGVWTRLTTNGNPPRSLQAELLELHAERAKEVAHTV